MENDDLMTKFTYLYSRYKEHFNGLHSLLWEVIINESLKQSSNTFIAIGCENILGISVKNQRGYIPTCASFKDGISYDERVNICNRMNRDIFRQDETEHLNILLSSMFKN